MGQYARGETSCQRGGRSKSTFDWLILISPMTIVVLSDERLVESDRRIILEILEIVPLEFEACKSLQIDVFEIISVI